MEIDFSKDYILEDERVLIRPFVEGDVKNLHTISTSEPDLWRFSQLSAAGEENLQKYITEAIEVRKNQTQYAFIIFDKQQNKYAGSSRFYNIDAKNNSLFLGYTFYGSEFQGTGLNKHAKYLFFRFAFEQLGVERIELRARIQNERSIAAMKSVGCTAEGILRNNVLSDGIYRNSIVLSILKDEWFGGAKEVLEGKLKV